MERGPKCGVPNSGTPKPRGTQHFRQTYFGVPKIWDTEFGGEGLRLRSPWTSLGEHWTLYTGPFPPHYVFPCPPQQTNGGGPGNHCCGSQTPILGAEETNVGGQETNAWVTGDPCLEANQPIVGDQVTYAWGENRKCWGPRKKCLKSGRSMGAGQERNCWGQGNELVVRKKLRGVGAPEPIGMLLRCGLQLSTFFVCRWLGCRLRCRLRWCCGCCIFIPILLACISLIVPIVPIVI